MKKISKPGLYILFNYEKQIVYIGKGKNVYSRVFKSINEKLNDKIKYFSILTEDLSYADCCVYEMYLINKYKPILNKDSNMGDLLSIVLPEIKFSKLYFVNTPRGYWSSNFDKENLFDKGREIIYTDTW